MHKQYKYELNCFTSPLSYIDSFILIPL